MGGELTRSLQINYGVFDLSLGVHYDIHPKNIPLGGAMFVNNLVWIDGYVRPRPGLVEEFPFVDSNEVVHISQFVPLTGSIKLIRVSKTSGFTMHVHVFDPQTTAWTRITPLSGISGVLNSTGQAPSSTNFKGYWFIAPGNSELYYYDGTTFDTMSSNISDTNLLPFDKPLFVASTESRLFIANTLESKVGDSPLGRVPYRIAWCDKTDPFKWSTGGTDQAGSARFDDIVKASQPITGIYGGANSNILVFKPTYVFQGTYVDSPRYYDFVQMQSGPGCVSHQTINEWRDGKILYLGDDNVYMQTVDQIPQAIGDKIRPKLSTFSRAISLDKSVAFIDRDNDLGTIITPENVGIYAGQTLRQFTISLRNGAWWEGVYTLAGDYVTCAFSYRYGVWQSKQLIGTKNGKIYTSTLSSALDGANAFPISWMSGIVSFRELTGNKTESAQLQVIRTYAESGQIKIGAYVGDNFDRFTYTDYGEQKHNGVGAVGVTERATGENFKILLYASDASVFPQTLSGVSIGFLLQGLTRLNTDYGVT